MIKHCIESQPATETTTMLEIVIIEVISQDSNFGSTCGDE